MACMEHQCTKCNWHEFDNEEHKRCPVCKAEIMSYFDELIDYTSNYSDVTEKEEEYEQ